MENVIKKPGKTIAFDFDGVISQYVGYKGEDNEEKPIEEIEKEIKKWKPGKWSLPI